MILKKTILTGFLLIFFQFGFSKINPTEFVVNNQVIDTTAFSFSPVKVNIFLYLEDLYDVEIKNNFFRAKMWYELSANKNHPLFYHPDSIFKFTSDFVRLKHWEDDLTESGSIENYSDSVYNYSTQPLKVRFDHNWNVRDYPFDKPKLKMVFIASSDSSNISLIPHKKNFASYSNKIENLKEGFSVQSITYEKDYLVNPFNTDLNDNEVLERLIFIVNLKREGFWLYLKLFLGTFLSFLVSWLVFFIPQKDFGSRVELSVGAIFGAVGNRAYVESIMPDVQVFTKSDMVNNAVIFLIIFNIIIILVQNNKSITWEFFENNRNAIIYSAYIFIVINTAILLW